ncbi:MAG TPA: CHAD domain-containing protein [Acidimicrobiia bacterium]|nr:CHAD domain-containing protein [Acidimicrobiia bacterium]
MPHLPALPAPEFHLIPGENLPRGLQRICLEQFETSLDTISSGGDLNVAIHELRKSNKRVRALLRMVRPVIGDKVYRAENDVLARASRLVSPVRDGKVLIDAVTRLRSRFGHLLASGVFGGIEERLRTRHERMINRVVDNPEVLGEVTAIIYRARSRYSAWPTDPSDPRYGGRMLPDSFRSIGGGVGQTYERGRKSMSLAYRDGTPARFHDWRKQVKYLRHQMEILGPVWPEVIGGLAASLEQLGDVLGDDHDQSELIRLTAALPELAPDPDERNLLVALSNQRRRELEGAARVMGGRVYAEGAPQFTGRLKAYWAAWSYGRD